MASETRTCKGVPASGGPRIEYGPHIECETALSGEEVFNCSSCDAEIERRQVAEEHRQVAADGARTHSERDLLLQSAGLSLPFVAGRKSLATFRQLSPNHIAALAAVRRWAAWRPEDSNRLGVLLCGTPGLGKSDLAEGVIRELVLQGKSARFANARALMSRLQASNRENSPESAADIIKFYTSPDTCRWLALDDLAASKPTWYTADSLYGILERRTRNELPTLITTNCMTTKELAARLRPVDGGNDLDSIRSVDRVSELCPIVITLTGTSQRPLINRPADGKETRA